MSIRAKQNLLLLTLVCFLVVAFVPSSAQQSPLWGSLKPGPYGVGFRSSVVFDSSRIFSDGKGARPVQISMWYPAWLSSTVSRLMYRDYFLLSVTEQNSKPLSEGEAKEAVASYKKLLGENGVEGEAMERWFAARCGAGWNEAPVKGTFPVVLIAQGLFHSAHHQAVLSEFIASHGFVVLTTPSQVRISGPMSSDEDVVPHAEGQAGDLLFALKSVEQNRQVDIRNVGLVGHSFGARSAFLLALRDPRVKGLVSLDGGIANKFGKEWVHKVPGFNPVKFQVPILHFYEDSETFIVPDFELIESLKGVSRTLIYMPGMRHMHFSSVGMVSAFIPGFDPSADRKLGTQCEAVANYTVDFLLANVKRDQQARKRLDATPNDRGYDGKILAVKNLNSKSNDK